ncbi:class I SAM-dependent methyltransferase [Streptomyces triticirhizae]|uniref:Class I SAM-dependent methyltransferase n=1 Tax=Streptomyces triticirhizae TaxID=2483353 RepID=A0A3M2LIY3_9ACTN|nr:class I SAM-dependent methyltransferase [Streptomyces triticirhizae]RMI37076.1 class I SAM-dependent methyltransferase [Streptomyces triticirhizae]
MGGHQHGYQEGHHHHGATEIDWASEGERLTRGAELHADELRRTAAWLRAEQPAARLVVDVGSGPGVVSCLLAEAFPEAEVLAVDGTPELLRLAEERAAALGLAGRVTTRRAELPGGLAGVEGVDLLWASRVVHHLGDQLAGLGELAATLRPGGLLALAEGGLPTRFLPREFGVGRAGLQARLDAANEEWFGRMRAELPGAATVVEDWPSLLTSAGLAPVGSRTFLTELPAPLGPEGRAYLMDRLTRQREVLDGVLDAGDLATLDVLLDPDAPEGLLLRPDAFYLSATTVHLGRAG